ncbi:HAD family hydrolase [Clostridium mediterraneense]|uniref:HAD family hydrolase n=1 Tax=Clostridium mediterraneense TaxID=1805472 RepID=UPI00082BB3C8|nr:HAD-IB family phosphatase [Clostridium mediterraneense]
MEKILAVDLCNTLYDSNTTQDFLNYSFAEDKKYLNIKRKNSSFMFKVINKFSNKLFKYDMSRALITQILKDKTDKEIRDLVDRFIDDFLSEKKIEKTHSIIEEYKKKGYKVIMISASYGFIAERIAEKLDIDGVISSKAELVDNKFTGKVEEDILYTKFLKFKNQFSKYNELVMITDNETDYSFVKETKKSYIVINKHNKAFWEQRKEEKFIFLED